MPLVMRKAWGRALVLTRAWQQRSGRQRALPLVVNPGPLPKTALHCNWASPRACTKPMVLRQMPLVVHLNPLVTPLVASVRQLVRTWPWWCPRRMGQVKISLVKRPRQTRRGKRTVLKAFLKTWGGLGSWVGFQKRPCEVLSRRSTTRKMYA